MGKRQSVFHRNQIISAASLIHSLHPFEVEVEVERMSDTVKCNFCSEAIPIDEQNTYACYMCGYGKDQNQNQNICDKCTMKYKCSRCSGQCCPKCVLNKFYCCGDGVILCGSHCPTYVNEDEEESCASKHIVQILPCGHMGCNYHKSGCWTCTHAGSKVNGNCNSLRENAG